MDTSTQNLKKDAMDEDNSEELIMRPSYSPRSPMKKNGPHWFGFDNTPLENTPNGIDLENHEDLSLSPMPIALNPAHRVSSTEIHNVFETDWLSRNLRKKRLLVFL